MNQKPEAEAPPVHQLRPKRKRPFRWFLLRLFFVFIGFPVLGGGGLWTLNEAGFFNVKTIQTEVDLLTTKNFHFRSDLESLEKQLDLIQGVSLWEVDMDSLSADISDLPWVHRAHVIRVWPSSLRISILPQRTPLVYKSDKGELRPITMQGDFLAPVAAAEAPDVVVLTGSNFAKEKKLRQQAISIIESIPETGLFSRQTIAEMSFDSREGFWMNLIKPRLQVKMGESDIPLKSSRVSQVVEYLESQQLEARVIDANLTQKVLVRLRKGP